MPIVILLTRVRTLVMELPNHLASWRARWESDPHLRFCRPMPIPVLTTRPLKWHGEDDSNIPLGFWRPRHSLYTITVLKSFADSPLVAKPGVCVLVGVEERAIAQVEVARFGSPHLRVELRSRLGGLVVPYVPRTSNKFHVE